VVDCEIVEFKILVSADPLNQISDVIDSF
jgi:hypothetical protein